ncbi:MAG TPA: helix-turn-helix transcriptional regulator [Longimicrobiaceae bacterium]|nr:helix-turn-helix transcriptional regulator [Longimicrobiaceae bacterium]
MKSSSSQEEAVFRSVKRACYAGLDSVTLRAEVARRIAPLLPYEAYSFTTTDPDTGLPTHVLGEGLPEGLIRAYVGVVYPYEQALLMLDRVRSGDTVARATAGLFTELLREQGVEHELNTILCAGGDLHGFLCLLRESHSRGYDEREIRFMRRIAPHLTRGLKTAATIDLAGAENMASRLRVTTREHAAPGVVVLDARGHVTLRNTSASAQLEDLADVGVSTGETPYALLSAVVLLRAQQQRAGADTDDHPQEAAFRVRGRSGRWYTLCASSTEPGVASESCTVVTIEPVGPGEVAEILTRLYGLSPREREILALTARGESTKAIAARLGLSVYTVQDHLGNACAKVGVRGRKALVAKLFFDGYAPALS